MQSWIQRTKRMGRSDWFGYTVDGKFKKDFDCMIKAISLAKNTRRVVAYCTTVVNTNTVKFSVIRVLMNAINIIH